MALSGELSQSERNHALQALRDGRARVCVATDVAARGIDLPDLGLVIHADLPNDAEVLQHRSGRTGRAGRKGVSVLLVPPARRRRAEEMLGRARVNAVWGDAALGRGNPQAGSGTAAAKSDSAAEPAREEDLAMAEELLKRTVRALAAAFVKMYRAGLPAPEEIEDEGRAGAKRHRANSATASRVSDRIANGGAASQARRQRRARHDAPRAERGAPPAKWRMASGSGSMSGASAMPIPNGCCRKSAARAKSPRRISARSACLTPKRLFQVDPKVAERFAALVSERKKGGVRIMPARDQTRRIHGTAA